MPPRSVVSVAAGMKPRNAGFTKLMLRRSASSTVSMSLSLNSFSRASANFHECGTAALTGVGVKRKALLPVEYFGWVTAK